MCEMHFCRTDPSLESSALAPPLGGQGGSGAAVNRAGPAPIAAAPGVGGAMPAVTLPAATSGGAAANGVSIGEISLPEAAAPGKELAG